MKAEQVARMMRVVDEQQEIIKRQNDIIDRLFEMAALHVSAEELNGLAVMKNIEEVARMSGDFSGF